MRTNGTHFQQARADPVSGWFVSKKTYKKKSTCMQQLGMQEAGWAGWNGLEISLLLPTERTGVFKSHKSIRVVLSTLLF